MGINLYYHFISLWRACSLVYLRELDIGRGAHTHTHCECQYQWLSEPKIPTNQAIYLLTDHCGIMITWDGNYGGWLDSRSKWPCRTIWNIILPRENITVVIVIRKLFQQWPRLQDEGGQHHFRQVHSRTHLKRQVNVSKIVIKKMATTKARLKIFDCYWQPVTSIQLSPLTGI